MTTVTKAAARIEHPLGACVQYPQTGSTKNESIAHIFNVDPKNYDYAPQASFQYSLGGTHGRVDDVVCKLLYGRDKAPVSCQKLTLSCRSSSAVPPIHALSAHVLLKADPIKCARFRPHHKQFPLQLQDSPRPVTMPIGLSSKKLSLSMRLSVRAVNMPSTSRREALHPNLGLNPPNRAMTMTTQMRKGHRQVVKTHILGDTVVVGSFLSEETTERRPSGRSFES